MTVKVSFFDVEAVEHFDGDKTTEDVEYIRIFKTDKQVAVINRGGVRWLKIVEGD